MLYVDFVWWGRAKVYIDWVVSMGGKGFFIVDGLEKVGIV